MDFPKNDNLNNILPDENREEVPFGDEKCNLCRMYLIDLKTIHKYRFEAGWGYTKVYQYIKHMFGIPINRTDLVRHFEHHVKQNMMIVRQTKPLEQILLKQPITELIYSDKNIENAHRQLIKLSEKFIQKLVDIQDGFDIPIEDLKASIAKSNPLKTLELWANVVKQGRELVRDVSTLRSPQIFLKKFLEEAISKIIYENCKALAEIIGGMQMAISERITAGKHITKDTFSLTFRENAIELESKLSNIARELMAKFDEELEILSKVI